MKPQTFDTNLPVLHHPGVPVLVGAIRCDDEEKSVRSESLVCIDTALQPLAGGWEVRQEEREDDHIIPRAGKLVQVAPASKWYDRSMRFVNWW